MLSFINKKLPSIKSHLYNIFIISHLIGRYDLIKEVRLKSQKIFASDELVLPDILSVALEYFRKKKVITKLEFMNLSAKMRWKAFTVAKVEQKTLLKKIKEKLAGYLELGGTIEEFSNDIDQVFDALGVTRLNPFHLDTVFLTNIMTAYGEGRQVVMDSLSEDEFPFRQILTVGDNRVRTAHKKLDEYTAKASDPVWTWLKTPFTYKCRCRISPVHVSEGLTESGYVPDVRGTKGFEFL